MSKSILTIDTRKKGKWIPHRAKYDNVIPVYECSICHKNNGFENTKYCPHCGCFMSEGGKGRKDKMSEEELERIKK